MNLQNIKPVKATKTTVRTLLELDYKWDKVRSELVTQLAKYNKVDKVALEQEMVKQFSFPILDKSYNIVLKNITDTLPTSKSTNDHSISYLILVILCCVSTIAVISMLLKLLTN